ncbi:MAG: hypothetical protein IV100_27985 [Myxococcales bacterium]|nr:hypothetical protein [Myxococcales bacterium]
MTSTSEKRWFGLPPSTLAIIAGAGVVLAVLALLSDGAYHDDDLTHYLFARDAWRDPSLLLNAWGRPGFTIPYALVAWIGDTATGFTACRLLSAAFTVATLVLVAQIAQSLRGNPVSSGRLERALGTEAAAVGWLLATPLFLHLGTTTLTETVCALYLAAGTRALTRGRPNVAATWIALAPLARHEAVVLVVACAAAFAWRREWRAVLLTGWALVAANGVAAALGWALPSAVLFEGQPEGAAKYGTGSLTFYLVRWVEACGPLLVVLAGAGGVALVRGAARGRTGHWRAAWQSEDGRRLVGALIGLGALGYVALQTLLYYRNTHASGGYARFLVPVAPWIALCAWEGARRVVGPKQRAHQAAIAVTGLLLATAVAFERGIFLAKLETIAPPGVLGVLPSLADWVTSLAALGAVLLFAALRFPRAGQGVLAVLLVLQSVQVALFLRPHRLGVRPAAVVLATRTALEANPTRTPLYSWSVWASYETRDVLGDGPIGSSAHEALYTGLHGDGVAPWLAAPPGALLVWDDGPETGVALSDLLRTVPADVRARTGGHGTPEVVTLVKR